MEENCHNNEVEIDIKKIFLIIKKRLWLIVLIIILSVTVTAIVNFFILTPVYEASTELLVNQSESDTETLYSYTDIQTDLKLINTYNVIIKSPRIIDIVISDYGIKLSSEQLIGKIKLSTVQDSQVISINVSDIDYGKAVIIANAIAETFQREIVDIMNVDNVQILTVAKDIANPVPVKPLPMLNIAISLVLGILIGLVLAFLLEYLDNSIKTDVDVERILGYPVLGSISIMENKNKKEKYIKRKVTVNIQQGEVNVVDV